MRSLFCVVLLGLACSGSSLSAAPTTNDFSGAGGLTPYVVKTWQSHPGNVLQNNALRLTYAADQAALVVFDRTAEGSHRRMVAAWELSCTSGADGFSLNFLNTAQYGSEGLGPFAAMPAAPAPMEEPRFTNSLSIAFDVYNPDDYQNLGEREVSLHWDGQERANRHSPLEFRSGSFLPVRAEVEFVVGGANVSVWINGTVIYDEYFIAGVVPYESRLAVGARTGGLSFVCRVDDVNVQFEEPGISFSTPHVVGTFDGEWISISNRAPIRSFELPADNLLYARIILAATLSEPPNGYDHWDRQMNFSVIDDEGQRFEIARLITPYRKGGTWYLDVTDYQSLLRGTTQMRAFIDTWVNADGTGIYGSGWLVTADFLYYEGRADLEAFKVDNLWNGEPRYGDPENPISDFFTPLTPTIDATAERVKLRFVVTGHGQNPNSQNAAEFLVRGRTVSVNGADFYNVLWRNDCYLNPCRAQFGNWWWSRAGWAPGDRVNPWEIEVTDLVTPGESAAIEYEADPYTNFNIVAGNPARHWVASQMISYRPPPGPTLLFHELQDGLVLRWSEGVLQVSDTISGPYNDVAGATSPWTNSVSSAQQFFRLLSSAN